MVIVEILFLVLFDMEQPMHTAEDLWLSFWLAVYFSVCLSPSPPPPLLLHSNRGDCLSLQECLTVYRAGKRQMTTLCLLSPVCVCTRVFLALALLVCVRTRLLSVCARIWDQKSVSVFTDVPESDI